MNARFINVIISIALIGMALFVLRAPTTFAQSPTEEPTKKPYVFPTPIFIPTFANDTPQPPPTRVTPNATTSATTVPEQPPGEQTYTVQPGDSLWIIAQKMYGNGAKYPLITSANDITTTTRLHSGMVLKIPAAPGVPTPTSTLVPFSPTPVVIFTPTAIPTSAFPTPTPSPTAASLIPTAIVGPASTVVNILSALFILASIASAILSYVAYARARHLERIAEGKPPIRLQ
jgi:LysM repeat protein